MMKKYLLSLFLALFVAVPVITFAEVSDIDPNPIFSQCVNLVNNLRYKDRDVNKNGEVSTLQDFLQTKNYLNNEPTGYFGILTVKAVKDFQKSNGINPTGYVGPITREKIKTLTCDGAISQPKEQKFNGYLSIQGPSTTMWGTHTLTVSVNESNCVGVISASTQSSCMRVYPVQAKNDSVLSDLKRYENSKVSIVGKLAFIELEGGFYGITASKVTSSSEVHDDLVISVVSGPQSLNVNQTGVWKIKVSNSNNENLYYSVDWGDVASIYPLPAPTSSVSSSNSIKFESEKSKTFKHSYSLSGSYTIKFTVISDNGIRCITTPCPSGTSASVTTIINVGDTTSIPSITVLSPNGGEIYTVGQQIPVQWKTTNIPANATIIPVFVYVDALDVEGSETHNGGAQSLAHVFNTGSALITPPAGFLNTLGKHFKIKLVYNSSYATDRNGINVSDSSDDTFTITNLEISNFKVISPNGGENVDVSNPVKVSFKTTYPYPAKHYINLVDETLNKSYSLDSLLGSYGVSFTQDQINQQLVQSIIVSIPDSYNLNTNNKYKIEICENNICDKSDGIFNIVKSNSSTPITVLSPNGEEFYVRGSTKIISWKDVVLDTSASMKYYDISVISDSSVPCVGEVCALVLPPPPVTTLIAKKVAGYSFPWIVGNGVFSTASGQLSIPNGSYLLKICRTDTNICDFSNTYFSVVSPLI
jgi:hypothetical protein